MVEDDDARWPIQLDLRLRAGRWGPSSETMGDVETDRPHQSAVERDRSRDRSRRRGLHENLAQPVHQPLYRPVGLDLGVPGLDRPPVAAHIEARAESDEREPPHLVTMLHALEEEAGAERGELEVHRRRGVQIGRYVEDVVHGLLRRSGVWASNEKTHLPETGDGFVWIRERGLSDRSHLRRAPSPPPGATGMREVRSAHPGGTLRRTR